MVHVAWHWYDRVTLTWQSCAASSLICVKKLPRPDPTVWCDVKRPTVKFRLVLDYDNNESAAYHISWLHGPLSAVASPHWPAPPMFQDANLPSQAVKPPVVPYRTPLSFLPSRAQQQPHENRPGAFNLHHTRPVQSSFTSTIHIYGLIHTIVLSSCFFLSFPSCLVFALFGHLLHSFSSYSFVVTVLRPPHLLNFMIPSFAITICRSNR
jgi:hypothetical protein